MTETLKIWIVIPAFNEATQIDQVLASLKNYNGTIIVVDDGSTDDTAKRVRANNVVLLTHMMNMGAGAALQTGIDYALLQCADYIATFDADGQHDADDIAVMLARLIEAKVDVALGSRFLGKTIGISKSRALFLKAATLFTIATTGLKLTDTHNGLRIFSQKAARQIRIKHNRMAHASEILNRIAALKLSYIEVPVTVRYTDYSKSKGQKLSNAFNILVDLLMGRI